MRLVRFVTWATAVRIILLMILVAETDNWFPLLGLNPSVMSAVRAHIVPALLILRIFLEIAHKHVMLIRD